MASPKKMLQKPSSFEELSKQIKEKRYKHIVVLVGAGISTAAGIPDFRSPGTGLYTTLHDKYPNVIGDVVDGGTVNGDGKSLERALSLEFFKEDRGKLLALIKQDFLKKIEGVEPTNAHMFLKELQDQGSLLRCYTQNNDGLEKAAGVIEDKLVTCHGADQAYCIDCGTEFDATLGKKLTIETGLPVQCNFCKSGIIKPNIVLYGEPMNSRFMELISRKETDFDQCDLLIVIGTSLKVRPFSLLPDLVDEGCVRVLINREKLEQKDLLAGFDGLHFEEGSRDLLLQGNCEEICGRILDELISDEVPLPAAGSGLS